MEHGVTGVDCGFCRGVSLTEFGKLFAGFRTAVRESPRPVGEYARETLRLARHRTEAEGVTLRGESDGRIISTTQSGSRGRTWKLWCQIQVFSSKGRSKESGEQSGLWSAKLVAYGGAKARVALGFLLVSGGTAAVGRTRDPEPGGGPDFEASGSGSPIAKRSWIMSKAGERRSLAGFWKFANPIRLPSRLYRRGRIFGLHREFEKTTTGPSEGGYCHEVPFAHDIVMVPMK